MGSLAGGLNAYVICMYIIKIVGNNNCHMVHLLGLPDKFSLVGLLPLEYNRNKLERAEWPSIHMILGLFHAVFNSLK